MLWIACVMVLVVSGSVYGQGGLPCLVDTNIVEDGEVIFEDCFPCWCVNGSQKCFWQECHPSPYGDPCLYEGVKYKIGQKIPFPFMNCYCLGGLAMCAKLPSFTESMFSTGGGKDCQSGFTNVPDGSVEPTSCGQCRCSDGLSLCIITDCPDESGQSCKVNGVVYPDGATIPDENSACVCDYGTEYCIRNN